MKKKVSLGSCMLIALCIAVIAVICIAIYVNVTEDEKESDGAEKTVSFVTYTDKKISSQRVKQGQLLSAPTVALERPGHRFLGWYDGEKKWDFATDKVTKDMELRAKWDRYFHFVSLEDEDLQPTLKNAFPEGSDGLVITGCKNDVVNVDLPSSYNGKTVLGLYFAFSGNKTVKNIKLPSTLTYIGGESFKGCAELESIVIPAGVTRIDAGTFDLCENLKYIFCEAESMPQGWDAEFNKTGAQVVFGYESK